MCSFTRVKPYFTSPIFDMIKSFFYLKVSLTFYSTDDPPVNIYYDFQQKNHPCLCQKVLFLRELSCMKIPHLRLSFVARVHFVLPQHPSLILLLRLLQGYSCSSLLILSYLTDTVNELCVHWKVIIAIGVKWPRLKVPWFLVQCHCISASCSSLVLSKMFLHGLFCTQNASKNSVACENNLN